LPKQFIGFYFIENIEFIMYPRIVNTAARPRLTRIQSKNNLACSQQLNRIE